MAGAIVAALIVGRVLRPEPMGVPPPEPPLPDVPDGPIASELAPADVDAAPIATPQWLVEIPDVEHLPDAIVHPPIAIGDRVLVTSSKVGYVALDRARGAIAWRRPAGAARLSAPLVVSPHDIVLVHECLDPIGARPDVVVPACFERLDPLDVAVRAGGPILVAVAESDLCTAGVAPWRLTRAGGGFLAQRGRCSFVFTLPGGEAHRTPAPPPPDDEPTPPDQDCALAADGTPWCQRVGGGRSVVEIAGVQLPGLLAITAAHDDAGRTAAVVRVDGTLRNDVLYLVRGGAIVWRWPLPRPLDGLGRNALMGLSVSAGGVFLHFEGARVAAFTAP